MEVPIRYENFTNNSTNVTDSETAVANEYIWILKGFNLAVICTSVLGIAGNVFSLAVWRMDHSSFNATVFFFKVLALFDILYLGTAACVMFLVFTLSEPAGIFFMPVSNFAQLVSVHVTLLIAVSRWIAVTFPFRAQRLMASRKIYISCVVILIYCGVFVFCQVAFITTRYFSIDCHITKETVGLVLPLLLLMIFNLSLLWTATRRPAILSEQQSPTQIELTRGTHQQDAECVEASSGRDRDREHGRLKVMQVRGFAERQPEPSQHQGQPQPQFSSESTNAVSRNRAEGDPVQHSSVPRRRHMVKAVLLVSLCSFIAYPVGVSLRVYLGVSIIDHARQSFPVKSFVLVLIVYLFHIFNSSINVFIYWFFVSKFRQLALRLKNRLCACLRCRRNM